MPMRANVGLPASQIAVRPILGVECDPRREWARSPAMAERRRKLASVTVPLVLEGEDRAPILFVNHLLAQGLADEMILTFSQITPPYMLGEITEAQVQAITSVPARVVVKVGTTPERVEEFIKVLRSAVRQQRQLAAALTKQQEASKSGG